MNDIKVSSRAFRVMEMFAGIGGFRYGLESVRDKDGQPSFNVVWSNQHEPNCRKQYAAQVYRERWGTDGFINRDINEVLADPAAMAQLDTLAPNVLVGGFPCQDYSVARPKGQSAGLEGKKGVLWWSIYQMLVSRQSSCQPIEYLILENVDRLVSSPAHCKGRDFAIILASLQSLGYGAEWRIVNAADYGYPQRRRRTFIVAYHHTTSLYAKMSEAVLSGRGWLTREGILATALPEVVKEGSPTVQFDLATDVLTVQETYTMANGRSRFASAGCAINGVVVTAAVESASITDFTRYVGQVSAMTLGDIVRNTNSVPDEFLLNETGISKWQYLKGAKSIPRQHTSGYSYIFTEGAIAFPDLLDRPSRTIITSEGGAAPLRTRHVVANPSGGLRRLVPDELDALNGFPRGFTAVDGVPASKRAFLAGNALVVGLVRQIGQALADAVHS